MKIVKIRNIITRMSTWNDSAKLWMRFNDGFSLSTISEHGNYSMVKVVTDNLWLVLD